MANLDRISTIISKTNKQTKKVATLLVLTLLANLIAGNFKLFYKKSQLGEPNLIGREN